MIEIVGIIASVLAIAGVVLNNRKVRWCFVIWMVSNAMTIGIHIHAGIWSLAGRDAVFFLLAVEGFLLWRKK
ncbi:MAG: nicotinamide mononucleotide transporter [Dehalococcoidia bacterium]|jgi:nicotinamide riboside transporter PnuC